MVVQESGRARNELRAAQRRRCRPAQGADSLDTELAARLNEWAANRAAGLDHMQSLRNVILAALCWGAVAAAGAIAVVVWLV